MSVFLRDLLCVLERDAFSEAAGVAVEQSVRELDLGVGSRRVRKQEQRKSDVSVDDSVESHRAEIDVALLLAKLDLTLAADHHDVVVGGMDQIHAARAIARQETEPRFTSSFVKAQTDSSSQGKLPDWLYAESPRGEGGTSLSSSHFEEQFIGISRLRGFASLT
jgi:hypothetical protein